jgi:hypothetical protein
LSDALADTRRWLERAVVGLNLCPFAKAVLAKGQVHFEHLDRELADLLALEPGVRDTTLLILPGGPADFHTFHAWAQQAERLVRKRGQEGIVQVAHFHPAFEFAGADADDITNFTNRAPYPTLHLLREDSVARAVQAFPDPAAIYEANMATLRRIGRAGWDALDVGPHA